MMNAPTVESANGRIARPALLARLDEGARHALTLLLAPAGFGKTTLLNQWQAHAVARGARVARVDLAPRDAEPVRFFRRLSEAIRRVEPAFDTLSYNSLGAEISVPADEVSDALLQAFDAIDGDLCVVIDDFQHARAGIVQRALSMVFERLPPNVRFVVATRIHPDFSLSRLRLEDRLFLVDGNDLRLARHELDALGAMLAHRPLADGQAERLMSLTEGWVAGVKIALLAWQQAGDLAPDALSGSQPMLVDYFAHAVLRDLAPEERDFLLQTALFDRFSASLCDAVLQRGDSARLLERLRQGELFLQAVPDRPGWFRYHALFQDFLAAQLRATRPDDIAPLHRRAAAWFLFAGDEERALHHARATDDPALFTSLLRQAADQWLRKGDFAAISRWLGALTDDELLADSELGLPLVGALIFSRRFNQANYYLDAMRGNRGLGAGRFADATTLPFLEVMLQLFQHDSDFQLNPDIAELLTGSSTQRDIRAFALAIIAYHHMLRADFDVARQHAAHAKAVLSQLGYFYLESYADLILILCDHLSGNLLPAIGKAESDYARWRDATSTPTWVNVTTAIAVVRYEQNRLADAQQLCEELVPAVSSACATEVIAWVYLTLSRLLSHRREHRRANRLLNQLEHILTLGNYDRFVSQVAFERVRQALVLGQEDLLDRIAVRHGLARRHAQGLWRQARDYDEAWERFGLATALWLRGRAQYDEADRVLDSVAETLRQRGVMGRAVVADANRVVIKLLQGNENGALRRLGQLVNDYGLLMINRNVLDEAPGLGAFMARSHRSGNLRLPELYLQVFRDDLEARMAEEPPRDAGAVQLLTAKEQEILDLLRQGLSNTEISERSGVALSTTKWHLKNIFMKLGVANRTEAAVLTLPVRRTTQDAPQ